MKIKNSLLIMLFILSVFSCKEIEQKNIITFKVIDSIKLKVPKYISGGKLITQLSIYEKEEIKNLFILIRNKAENQNEILSFNLLEENSLYKKIILPYEGPNSFKKTTVMGVKSMDSIFVSGRASSKLYLINKNGNILDFLNIDYHSKNQEVNNIHGSLRNPLIFKKDTVFCVPYLDQLNENVSIAFKIDFKNKKIKSLDFKIPQKYFSSPYFNRTIYSTSNQNQFIYSSSNNHNIWVTDSEHNTFQSYEARSDYFESFEISKPENDIYYEYLTKSRYKSITYDKYRDVYYRFFYPGVNNVKVNSEDIILKSLNPSFFSIIILDNNFKKIGEVMMPKDTYILGSYFITKEGLNLNVNHMNNPNFNDNYYQFHTLKLVR